MSALKHIPIIDVHPLVAQVDNSSMETRRERDRVAAQIGQACRETGFFYITGHGVDEGLQQRLEQLSRKFFAQKLETKLEIGMRRGGKAWRGYFPVGNELTSGKPDLKEGIYFGAELDGEHPLVRAGIPMHGPNLFPDIPQFPETVLDYLALQCFISTWVLFTTYKFHWGALQAGLSLALLGLMTAIVQAGIIRPVVIKFGERRIIIAGLSFSLIGYLLYAMDSRGWMMYGVIVLNGSLK